MSRLQGAARKIARDWADGLHAAWDVMLWGRAYPRRVSLDQLRRMRKRPDEEPT